MGKKSIDDKILEYMKDGNKISQWDCYELFSYTRLSATIFNLKQKGFNIKDKWCKGTNSRGVSKKYKVYWIQPDLSGPKESVQTGLGFNVESKYRGYWEEDEI